MKSSQPPLVAIFFLAYIAGTARPYPTGFVRCDNGIAIPLSWYLDTSLCVGTFFWFWYLTYISGHDDDCVKSIAWQQMQSRTVLRTSGHESSGDILQFCMKDGRWSRQALCLFTLFSLEAISVGQRHNGSLHRQHGSFSAGHLPVNDLRLTFYYERNHLSSGCVCTSS